MKSLFLFIIAIITCTVCNAQTMQVVPGNAGVYSGVHTNDMLLLSQSDIADKTNTDVNGNPFWNEEWKTAILYTGDYAILVSKVKLNLYSNDIWYIMPDSSAMIARKGKVKAVTFFNGNDTSSVLANFFFLKDGDGDNYHYYQLMNEGKAMLLKLTTVNIDKYPFDPFTGKAERKYMPHSDYYLLYDSKMTLLKGNNKDVVFEALQPDAVAKEWLSQNKNKLKSKDDILVFLNYFNTNTGK